MTQPQGDRAAGSQWKLHRADKGGSKADQALTFSLADGSARLAGPDGEILLDSREVVSHPKIALVPIRDRERFLSCFDNVPFNLGVTWIVQ